ncbi:MAG: cytochrome c [Acidobacteriota bacterium]|nr:cytochrome c [Acidobacteriota bacterium]
MSYAYLSAHAEDQKDGTQSAPELHRPIDTINGPALYKAYCASCHGVDAKGVGPMAEWLKIKTPDLTRLAARNGGAFPLARVQRVISGEESITSGHGTREMPVWGPVFSQVDRDQDFGKVRIYNVAKYLESLQAR